jgi:hypothetical protein
MTGCVPFDVQSERLNRLSATDAQHIPFLNSVRSGTTRNPDQTGRRGISPKTKPRADFATSISSSKQPRIGGDCFEAYALIWTFGLALDFSFNYNY